VNEFHFNELYIIGLALIYGFLGGKLANLIKLPAVIGYIIAGIILGYSGLKFLDPDKMGLFAELALGIIAFMIGSELRLSIFFRTGREIITILFTQALGTSLLVCLGVYLLTRNLPISLIFGALSAATAPAGTAVVLQESKAKGPLTNMTYALVGLDDGLTILIYVFAVAIAKILLLKTDLSFFKVSMAFVEIFGSILLGGLIALVAGYFLSKVKIRNDALVVSLGAVCLCTALSECFHLSLILSNLTFGMVFTNLFLMANRRAYNALQSLTPPLYIIFFVIAGAHLRLWNIAQIGAIGLVYIVCRIFGKVGGSYFGAVISGSSPVIRKYLGLAMLPQAGVAIGLAILVTREFAGYPLAIIVINTITAADIFFEMFGPIGTKIAIAKAGEIGKKRSIES
jgi:Kef-type K+ transport system membrane component KefB